MTTYAVHRRTDGAELMRYTADAVVEWQGCDLATCTHDEVPDQAHSAPPLPPPQTWERTEFLRRFTAAERIAAKRRRATDLVLDDFWGLLESSPEVHSIDPDLRRGLGYLVMLGLLTAERAQTIVGDA